MTAFGFVPLIHCSLVVHTSIFTFTKAIVGVLAFAAQIRCGMEHKRARTGTRFQKWFASECINDQWRSNLFVEISNFHAYKIDVICRFDINQRSRRPSSPNSRLCCVVLAQTAHLLPAHVVCLCAFLPSYFSLQISSLQASSFRLKPSILDDGG